MSSKPAKLTGKMSSDPAKLVGKMFFCGQNKDGVI